MVAVSYCPSPNRKLGQCLIVLGIILGFAMSAVGLSIFISLFLGIVMVIVGLHLMRGRGDLPVRRPVPGLPNVRCDHCGRTFEEKTDRCPNCGERTTLIWYEGNHPFSTWLLKRASRLSRSSYKLARIHYFLRSLNYDTHFTLGAIQRPSHLT